MAEEYQPVTHVIFDLDGLILNSEPAAKQILDEILEKYRKGPLPLDVQARILGRNEKDELNLVITEMKLPIRYPTMKEHVNELEEKRYKKAIPMFPGVQRLVCHLRKNNIPMAVTTGCRQEIVDLKIGHHLGIFSNFKHIVTGSDEEVPIGKPDPTIFHVCAARFEDSPPPEKCLVIEDSPAGVSAACCAGMQVVMIPDPLMDPDFIKDATLVLPRISEFQPELFGLPPIIQ